MGSLTLNRLMDNLAYYISVTKLKVPNYLTIHSATGIYFQKQNKKTVNGQVTCVWFNNVRHRHQTPQQRP